MTLLQLIGLLAGVHILIFITTIAVRALRRGGAFWIWLDGARELDDPLWPFR